MTRNLKGVLTRALTALAATCNPGSRRGANSARWRALGVLAVATAVAALGSPALAGAAETPDKDPFYKAPKAGEPHENWQEEAPGTVLKKRALSIYGYSAD